MCTVTSLGFHVYQKKGVRGVWTNAHVLLDESRIVWNADWKEDVQRGRGPVEDSSVVHNLVPTAIYGACIRYWDPQTQRAKKLYVTVLTDVLNKSGPAAVALERHVLKEVRNDPEFAKAWAVATHLEKFYDSGRGFLSEVCLGDQLLAWTMEFRKHMLVLPEEDEEAKNEGDEVCSCCIICCVAFIMWCG